MDLTEALGIAPDSLPPTARRVLDDVFARLQAGESPRSVLADAGLSEEQIEDVELALRQIADASPGERSAVRGQLAVQASGLAWLERWLRSDDPAADWGVAMLPDFTDEERLAALRRILGRMKGEPLHPRRFEANREALLAAAEDLDVRIDELAEARGWEAVAEALEGLTPRETRDAPGEVMRRFRGALQRLVCDDLLPDRDWGAAESRSRPLESAPPEAVQEEVHAATRTRIEVEQLIEAAGLSTYKRTILDLALRGYSNAEIADQLDRSRGAIRRARSDAYAKIRDVERSDE